MGHLVCLEVVIVLEDYRWKFADLRLSQSWDRSSYVSYLAFQTRESTYVLIRREVHCAELGAQSMGSNLSAMTPKLTVGEVYLAALRLGKGSVARLREGPSSVSGVAVRLVALVQAT